MIAGPWTVYLISLCDHFRSVAWASLFIAVILCVAAFREEKLRIFKRMRFIAILSLLILLFLPTTKEAATIHTLNQMNHARTSPMSYSKINSILGENDDAKAQIRQD